MRAALDWLKEEKKKNEQNLLHKNAQIDFPAFSISLMVCLVLRNNGNIHNSFITIVFLQNDKYFKPSIEILALN